MRVVHLSHRYGLEGVGGAVIAASRLHHALLEQGIDSHFLCVYAWPKVGEGVEELPPCGTLRRRLYQGATGVLRNVWRLAPGGDRRSLNLIPSGMGRAIRELKPDVVHIHWIALDSVAFRELEDVRCPIVVHLHDFWMINGFEPYPHDDRRFIEGFTKENSSWLERNLFERKRRFAERHNVIFVGPSEWSAKVARESIIGRGHKVFAVPYCVEKRFGMWPTEPQKKFVVLFGADGGRTNPLKGFEDLEKALLLLPREVQQNTELRIFGEDAQSYRIGDVEVKFLGRIGSVEKMAEAYRAADVYAFPSREETFGQTKVEAMMCGTPVLAFDRTACAEGIVHGQTGWIASGGDVEAYKNGIIHHYRLFLSEGMHKIRQVVCAQTFERYSDGNTVMKMLDAYRGGLRNHA